ncbi:uncharacterized protein LOC122360827 [Puntigrus tetrazona]|uniref:uncharacterized protein LOC122360827 n=1 Tax=Puntigrus tetrazona TaxID=1606681 RepID=UPI001C8A2F4E|nr:uncharacterized protein LOC122360827 [Puntigrus tetrazona]
MNHFHTHNTSAMKDVQSMEAVSMPLNEGIVSICNICKFLKKAHICPITDTVSNYNQIRKHVEDAEQHLKTSDTIVTEKLRYLNERMEHLIIEKLIVEREIKEKIQAVNTLSTKKSSAEQSLGCFQAALEQAKRNVESKNDAIRRCQEQMSTNDDIVTAGTALLAVPILGWIAGPIMMSSGQQAYEEALNALRNAESDRQNCMSQVRNWEKKVDHYDTVISRTTNEIWQTNQAIKRNESRMERLKCIIWPQVKFRNGQQSCIPFECS